MPTKPDILMITFLSALILTGMMMLETCVESILNVSFIGEPLIQKVLDTDRPLSSIFKESGFMPLFILVALFLIVVSFLLLVDICYFQQKQKK